MGDEPDGAVGLLPFKRSTKAIDTGVAVHQERARAVLHGALNGEDQDRRSGLFRAQVTHDVLHGRREQEFDALVEVGGDYSNPFGHISQEFSIVRKAAQERAKLFQTPGRGHERQRPYFFCVWAHACWRNGVTQEIGVRRAEPGFRGREPEMVLSQALEEGTNGLDMGPWVQI